jgi:hypothetical protein
MARRSSSCSRMPPASPASTRLQYSASKCIGCLRNAADRLVPVSTSDRMSPSSLVRRGLVAPRPTMSKACSSGTPAFIMVASWRVNSAMSFCLIELPPLVRRFFTLVSRMPWRRRLALTWASPPARISPRTTLPFLSRPSHSKTSSLTFLAADAVAMRAPDRMGGRAQRVARPCGGRWCSIRCRHWLVTAMISSSVVTPWRTFTRPDWRRSRTPSRWACWAMSIAVPSLRMMRWMASDIGITW